MIGSVRLIAAVWPVLLLLSCFGVPQHPAEGRLAWGQEIKTTVDSEIARYYLEKYLQGVRSKPEYDDPIKQAHETGDGKPLDSDNLQRLSERFSPDFAALYFVNRVNQYPSNRKAQQAFRAHLAALRTREGRAGSQSDKKFESYLMAFVPGYAYKRDPATGADFSRQRSIMGQAGFKTLLVETDEVGTVEKNAAIIASALIRLSKEHGTIIVVSTSKGGPEVALALGKLMTPQESRQVRAWISVGGILRGSPLADQALVWPRSWWAKVGSFFLGLPQENLENLSTRKRKEVFNQLIFPNHVFVVHYVGVPLSGQVSRDVRGRYRALRKLGPNDGLTLLTDELVPRGVVITDMGLDHYYRDPEIDLKTVALAYVVFDEVEPPPAGAGGSLEQRDLPELRTRAYTALRARRE